MYTLSHTILNTVFLYFSPTLSVSIFSLEMSAISRINNKRFGKLIFQLFDKENKGEITFEEFLVTAFGALSLDDSALARFSFRLFDLDNSGQLSPNEIDNLINIVCGSNQISKAYFQMEMSKVDRNREDFVSLEEFLRMTKKSKLILFPAFEMRDKFQKNTLGIYRWRKISRERKLNTGDESIFEIFPQLQTVPASFKNVINYPMTQLQKRRNSLEPADRSIFVEKNMDQSLKLIQKPIITTEMEDLGRRGSKSKKILPIESSEIEPLTYIPRRKSNLNPSLGNSNLNNKTTIDTSPRRKSNPNPSLGNIDRNDRITIGTPPRRKSDPSRRQSGLSVQLKNINRNDYINTVQMALNTGSSSVDMKGVSRNDNNNIDNPSPSPVPEKRRNSVDMTGSHNVRDLKSRSTDAHVARMRRKSSIDIMTNMGGLINPSPPRRIGNSSVQFNDVKARSRSVDVSLLHNKNGIPSRSSSNINFDVSALNNINTTGAVLNVKNKSRNNSVNVNNYIAHQLE